MYGERTQVLRIKIERLRLLMYLTYIEIAHVSQPLTPCETILRLRMSCDPRPTQNHTLVFFQS